MKWVAPVLVGLVGIGYFLGFDSESGSEQAGGAMRLAAKAPVIVPDQRPVDGFPTQRETLETRLDGFREKPELIDAVRAVDLWSPLALSELSERLRTSDPAMVQRFFVDALDESAGKLAERDRIILIAEHFQGDGLMPFWQKVIERSPPRTVPELRAGEHPDVLVAQELYKAVRAMRVLAATQVEAREYLARVAVDDSLHKNDVLLRSQAYYAVKEVDISASIRIVRGLDVVDPLAVALSKQ